MNSLITNKTFSITKRKELLTKLKQMIIKNQAEISNSLKKDLNKSVQETYLSEIGPILMEINLALKNLKKWTKAKKVRSNLLIFKAKSFIYNEPYGKVLIISPWNYPWQLLLIPLVGAIAAGNQVVLKPSEIAKASEKLITKLIKATFKPTEVEIVNGNAKKTESLLNQKFDLIFFTGSSKVGSIIMEKAAKHLTPVVLELGGKSPCIVNDTQSLVTTAERIAWGKLLNAGQTCIAPDYLLIKKGLENDFLRAYQQAIVKFYGDNLLNNPDYPKIINQKHHQHLLALLAGTEQLLTTQISKTKIGPTVVNVDINHPLMKEEIFGPILPMISYSKIEEAIDIIANRPKPLALYLFTEDSHLEKRILQNLSFGGATINDTLKHFINPNLPFGGIGLSGMNHYHGKETFNAFNHQKSVVKSSTKVKVNLQFFPSKKETLWLIKKIMK